MSRNSPEYKIRSRCGEKNMKLNLQKINIEKIVLLLEGLIVKIVGN
jgi:hypothetical protein